ncbi:putative dual specificity protein kinase Fuz7 [Jimgerdemannia flammicorona]|uniref:Putative dual specificity protein kinase Fuz7 n=1 Tax=Jimgerdemannia flammicorona TaxID=994334 RepID=A0A433QSC7_9FUNG|nr:putative dual specificity protein kinase Fuz7 [Jimgerdemannia flammicorona]
MASLSPDQNGDGSTIDRSNATTSTGRKGKLSNPPGLKVTLSPLHTPIHNRPHSPGSPGTTSNPQNPYRTNEFKEAFYRTTESVDAPGNSRSSAISDVNVKISGMTSGDMVVEDHIGELKPEDFDILSRLGEGAAGTVRQVLHRPSGIVMAKKSITADPDTAIQRQILRELAFLRACVSPYIVSFYGAFLDEEDTTIAICMEYCEAGSLEDIYKKCKELGAVIGEGVLGKLAIAVLKGLVYLHQQKKIHRDIKPSNILMTRSGEIKLCDFGVSGELINSLAQTFTGTKYYMAPERIQGAPYAVQSDIWSLGLTIIEVAQNRPALPPPGYSQLAIFELLDFIVHQPIEELPDDRSAELRDFVRVCLTKDPAKRPGPAMMLNHAFIQKWENTNVDLGKFVRQLYDWPE